MDMLEISLKGFRVEELKRMLRRFGQEKQMTEETSQFFKNKILIKADKKGIFDATEQQILDWAFPVRISF